MHQEDLGKLQLMAGEIGTWLRKYRIPINRVEKLKAVSFEERHPFTTLSAKRCSEWFHMGTSSSSKQRDPHDETEDWIRSLHACISHPTKYEEVLRRLDIRQEFWQEIFGTIKASPVQVAEYPQPFSGPQVWCDSAVRQACQGQPVQAFHHLKMTFNDYVNRNDLESAIVLVPTMIYIIVRHFSNEKLVETAIYIRSALARKPVSKCSPIMRRLAAVLISTFLTEHGKGKLAEAIFEKANVDDLVHDRTPLPWSKTQIMRTMATHLMLHDPCPQSAMCWLDQAAGHKDPFNQRGISAMRYGIAMQQADYDEAWKRMEEHYVNSLKCLKAGKVTGSHLKVCNDVYLGMLARHFSGTAYNQKQQLDDIQVLRVGLDVYGINTPQMDDELMRFPVQKLRQFPDLYRLRERLIRTPFHENVKGCEDVIALVDVLLDRRDS
jgi:hypothetical protein